MFSRSLEYQTIYNYDLNNISSFNKELNDLIDLEINFFIKENYIRIKENKSFKFKTDYISPESANKLFKINIDKKETNILQIKFLTFIFQIFRIFEYDNIYEQFCQLYGLKKYDSFEGFVAKSLIFDEPFSEYIIDNLLFEDNSQELIDVIFKLRKQRFLENNAEFLILKELQDYDLFHKTIQDLRKFIFKNDDEYVEFL